MALVASRDLHMEEDEIVFSRAMLNKSLHIPAVEDHNLISKIVEMR